MLAGRLALKWGIVDVRGWLKKLPAGTLDFWEAFDAVEPIGEEWRQSAMIAQQSALYAYCKTGNAPPELDDFMPSRFKREKRKPQLQPMGQGLGTLKQIVGFKEDTPSGNND